MARKSLVVRIDDRIRLMSAILAATDWPERAQQRKGHRPHIHARTTSQWLAEFRDHPAIANAQYLLEQGAPMQAFFAYALKLDLADLSIYNPPPWAPPDWNYQMFDLYSQSGLYELWERDEPLWAQAEAEAQDVMAGSEFYELLEPFVGPIRERLIYMPNISYPSDETVGVRMSGNLMAIGHPRIAWGDNPPWPFNEDPGHVYSTALHEYARLLILSFLRRHKHALAEVAQKGLPVDTDFKTRYRTWGDQFVALFVPGLIAIYLEYKVDLQEAKSFILMEKRMKGITVLPGVISVLERYLNEYYNGKYDSFVEYLPYFPGHLRIAKTITAI